MKHVLVACGNGIATSTVVAAKIRDYLKAQGIEAQLSQCKLLEVESKAGNYDLLVTTGHFAGGKVDIPVVGAMALLTGIGEADVLQQIATYLK